MLEKKVDINTELFLKPLTLWLCSSEVWLCYRTGRFGQGHHHLSDGQNGLLPASQPGSQPASQAGSTGKGPYPQTWTCLSICPPQAVGQLGTWHGPALLSVSFSRHTQQNSTTLKELSSTTAITDRQDITKGRQRHRSQTEESTHRQRVTGQSYRGEDHSQSPQGEELEHSIHTNNIQDWLRIWRLQLSNSSRNQEKKYKAFGDFQNILSMEWSFGGRLVDIYLKFVFKSIIEK